MGPCSSMRAQVGWEQIAQETEVGDVRRCALRTARGPMPCHCACSRERRGDIESEVAALVCVISSNVSSFGAASGTWVRAQFAAHSLLLRISLVSCVFCSQRTCARMLEHGPRSQMLCHTVRENSFLGTKTRERCEFAHRAAYGIIAVKNGGWKWFGCCSRYSENAPVQGARRPLYSRGLCQISRQVRDRCGQKGYRRSL